MKRLVSEDILINLVPTHLDLTTHSRTQTLIYLHMHAHAVKKMLIMAIVEVKYICIYFKGPDCFFEYLKTTWCHYLVKVF